MSLNFRKDDYKRIRYFYIFSNQTSGTQCYDFRVIRATELGKESLNLIVPNSSCANGHQLMLVIFNTPPRSLPRELPADGQVKGAHMVIMGKITAKTILDDNKFAEVVFKFGQFDIENWEDFCFEYKEQQEKIIKTLKEREK